MRTTCRSCGDAKSEMFLDLGPQPLAGGFLPPTTEAKELEKMHPLPIHFCHSCGLVQTFYVVPAETLFTNYCFSSSTVPYLVQHFTDYAKWLKAELKANSVLEFGCNDGILLKPLEAIGVKAVGIDISENITEVAREKGLKVKTGFFNPASADQLKDEYGAFDVVTGSNCFPHNDEPEHILKAAKKVLKPDGHLCLEIMYAGDLLEKLQWDSMYHEHLNYFSLKTLDILLRRHGFHTVHVERLPMHAGTLRLVAAVNPSETPRTSVAELMKYEEATGLNRFETWKRFAHDVLRQIKVTKEVLGALSTRHRIWGYGAAGRATMWVNACQMNYLEFMVDSSPFRSGRLMPGTHTPIVFPEALRTKPPDYIFVPAWNYIDEIRRKEAWFQGIWCIPVPFLKFL
ncbi:MAG: methyltransferase domain-containing protein [Bdellovibrionales bacterium]